MNNLHILPALMEDAGEILAVNIAAYDSDTKLFGEGDQGGPPGYCELSHIRERIASGRSYKILLSKRLIGWFYLDDVDDATAALHSFCISPEYHNRGYGSEVLKRLAALLPAKSRWVLGTPAYSLRNHHVYEKAGFCKTGESEDGFLFLYEKTV